MLVEKSSCSSLAIFRVVAIAGGIIIVVAFLWMFIEFIRFNKHSLVVSNTSGKDIVLLGASIDGKGIAQKYMIVYHASKAHLSSKYYVGFKWPSQGGVYKLSLFTKEDPSSCELNIPQHVDCMVMARKDRRGALLCVCDYMDYSSL